jgi:hypothetical protein
LGSPAISVLFRLVFFWIDEEAMDSRSMVLRIVSSPLLSLIPRALRVLRVLSAADHVTVEAGPFRCMAACPSCGSVSWRVHSNYMRKLRDLPSHGRVVVIHLSARRFRCLNAACARKTFAERLDDAFVSARRTKRLGDLQHHLGLALGGEAGTRLAERVAVPISADTLLRMAASAVSAESPAATPRVLAVDDWATLAKVPAAKPLESQGRAGVAAIATEPFWSIWNAIRSWICCPTDKRKRWPPGFASTPVSRLSRATAQAPMLTVSAKGRRTLFKLLTVGTCCATSAMPYEPSSIVNMWRFDGLPSRSSKRRWCRRPASLWPHPISPNRQRPSSAVGPPTCAGKPALRKPHG